MSTPAVRGRGLKMSRRALLKAITVVGGGGATLGAPPRLTAQGLTASILPHRGRSRQRFIIVDRLWRLVSNTLVLFTDQQTGELESTSLRGIAPHGQVGRGRIPGLAAGVTYDVTVQPPGQAPFSAGTFHVQGPREVEPTIDPESGQPGSTFTINDPVGRMRVGDIVLFYVPGTDPAAGTPAGNVAVSPDGMTLTGAVPAVAGDATYGVSVRPTPAGAPRFEDLAFYVEQPVALDPTITPEMGAVGSDVTITDPQGRMQATDVCAFHPPGVPPDPSSIAPGTTVSPDGTTLHCKVPNVTVQRTYDVTVRATLADAPRFAALSFFVEGVVAEPTISPTEGPPGSSFEIDDAAGRMQVGDDAIFYLPSTDPAQGTPASSVSVGSDGTRLTGTVPNVTTGLVYLVSVRAEPTAPSRFADLTFAVI